MQPHTYGYTYKCMDLYFVDYWLQLIWYMTPELDVPEGTTINMVSRKALLIKLFTWVAMIMMDRPHSLLTLTMRVGGRK